MQGQQVGIDLGLHDLAKLSTGESIPAPNFYRDAEPALAMAQRARKQRRAQAIHAKVANRRHDFLHKLSTRLAREFDHVVVGNVNAAGLAKTSMAKSVLDAGWSTLRRQLAYKATLAAGIPFP
jgi:IS605 OrfB family transposase